MLDQLHPSFLVCLPNVLFGGLLLRPARTY
jgi:hypothetical protein